MLIAPPTSPDPLHRSPVTGGRGTASTANETISFSAFLDAASSGGERALYAFGDLGIFGRRAASSPPGSALLSLPAGPGHVPDDFAASVYGGNSPDRRDIRISSAPESKPAAGTSLVERESVSLKANMSVPASSQESVFTLLGMINAGMSYLSGADSAEGSASFRSGASFTVQMPNSSAAKAFALEPQPRLTVSLINAEIEIVVRMPEDTLAGREALQRALAKVARDLDIDISTMIVNGDRIQSASVSETGGIHGTRAG
jgi:hypothetical protein